MYFDQREAMAPAVRTAKLSSAIAGHVAYAKSATPAYAELLKDIEPNTINSVEALSKLPITRKSDFLKQSAQPHDPFSGRSASGWTTIPALRQASKVFQSPGPIYEPEGSEPNYWRMARAMYAAGIRRGNLVHNCFSYHLTPAGAMMEAGAAALGCTVFPGGVGQTDLQVIAMRDLQPQAYTGTPSFLRILLEHASDTGRAIVSLKSALLSGEAFPNSLREWLWERGVDGYQCYATADVGLIAYETEAREGLIVDEDVILEIVDPVTGQPVADGLIGEVVVTTFSKDYPLIRFATGDLSMVIPGSCPTGRTNTRIKGWLGRVDQSTKVRGMFVHPEQVLEVLRRHPAVTCGKLVISGKAAKDELVLRVESDEEGEDLRSSLIEAMREVTKLRSGVEFVPPNSIGATSKLIDDCRSNPN